MCSILSGLPAAKLIRVELTGRCAEKLRDELAHTQTQMETSLKWEEKAGYLHRTPPILRLPICSSLPSPSCQVSAADWNR